MRRHNSFVRAATWLLTVILFAANCASAVTLVKGIQYTLFGGDSFYVPGDVYSREFFLYEDIYAGNLSNVVGQFRIDGDSSYNYEIRGGSIEITPSRLIQDQSYATSYPVSSFNPYIAKGLFDGDGVTLTMNGYITTVGGGEILSDYGTIIEATVTADFIGTEQLYSASFLGFQLHFNITGGELFTGAQTGFALSPEFVADITLRYCTQTGQTALKNFASDIGYAQPSIVQFNAVGDVPVPEPASIVLFGLAVMLTRKYKRKK